MVIVMIVTYVIKYDHLFQTLSQKYVDIPPLYIPLSPSTQHQKRYAAGKTIPSKKFQLVKLSKKFEKWRWEIEAH